jgi:hypothetical protein
MRIAILVFIMTVATAYAYSPHEDPSKHPGAYCINCHKRFIVDNPTVVEMFPCNKQPCHSLGEEERAAIHLKEYMCEDCHAAMSKGFDIHNIHRGKVNCKICHLSPRGWNSSIATIPEPTKKIESEGYTIYIPGDTKCPYCHKTAEKPKKLHQVHQPVINTSCKTCHGKMKPSILKLWGIEAKKIKKEGLLESLNKKISSIFQAKVDMSCNLCHEELVSSFYTSPVTKKISKVHMWASQADIFFGPNGELKYEMEFTINNESTACLLCHKIETVNVYTGSHKIYWRKCTNESCHGDIASNGTRIFVDAGSFNLPASARNSHGLWIQKIEKKGWTQGFREICGCHQIHPTYSRSLITSVL